MKVLKITTIVITSALIIVACGASKKAIAPGPEQLAAAQAKYSDVTQQTLSNGYSIYTGACTDCHRAKDIYSRDEVKWEKIIKKMSMKAKLTDTQKDELTKYIMSVKATQPQAAK